MEDPEWHHRLEVDGNVVVTDCEDVVELREKGAGV